MSRLQFLLPNVAPGTRVRFDTASGSNSAADIVNNLNQAIAGSIITADTSGRLASGDIYGPNGVSTLYMKTLDGGGNPTGSPTTLTASHAPAPTAAYLSVGTTNIDVSAYGDSIAAALAAAPSGSKRLHLNKALYTEAVVLPSNTILVGAGEGLTTIKLPNGANTDTIANSDFTNGGSFIEVRDLTVDGNKANQAGNAAAIMSSTSGQLLDWDQNGANPLIAGIHFEAVDHFRVENVTVKNVDGKGTFIIGKYDVNTIPLVTDGSFLNVTAHDNGLDGVDVGRGLRRVQWGNVRAYKNGRDGVLFDVSETQSGPIIAYGNIRDGVYIRNVFGCNFPAIQANHNGRHGIRVRSMINSAGGVWTAMSNGWQSSPNGALGGDLTALFAAGYDVWFDGDATMGYGITDQIMLGVIMCGPTKSGGITKWAEGNQPNSPTETYGLFVDDAVTGDVYIAEVYCPVAGTSGDIRVPASPGSLVVQGKAGASANWRMSTGNIKISSGRLLNSTSSAAPGLASGAAAGTSPPAATIVGTDVRGTVKGGSGTSPAAGNYLVAGFASAYPATPTVTISPLNAASAALQPYVTSVSTSGFTVGVGVAPAASQAATTYQFAYSVTS